MEFLLTFLIMWTTSNWAFYELGRRRERRDFQVMLKASQKADEEKEV